MTDEARTHWDRRYRTEGRPEVPSPFLDQVDAALPIRGHALDVAGGGGRHAIWLARRGLTVTVVDVSEAGLSLAAAAAAREGVQVELICADLETEPLPPGPWDVVLCFHYLQRDLFPEFAAALAPGGTLVAVLATVRNLERHDRPPARHLLEEGELPGLVAGLNIASYEEGWLDEGRHEARLVACKPG